MIERKLNRGERLTLGFLTLFFLTFIWGMGALPFVFAGKIARLPFWWWAMLVVLSLLAGLLSRAAVYSDMRKRAAVLKAMACPKGGRHDWQSAEIVSRGPVGVTIALFCGKCETSAMRWLRDPDANYVEVRV